MVQNKVLFSQISLDDLGLLIEEKVTKAVEKIVKNQQSPQEKNLYTRKEASELLDVSFTTLFLWNNQGILKAKKIGKKVFYSKEDILSRLNS